MSFVHNYRISPLLIVFFSTNELSHVRQNAWISSKMSNKVQQYSLVTITDQTHHLLHASWHLFHHSSAVLRRMNSFCTTKWTENIKKTCNIELNTKLSPFPSNNCRIYSTFCGKKPRELWIKYNPSTVSNYSKLEK